MKKLVVGEGNVFANLIVIGEAPGSTENLIGKPFVGKSGKLLRKLLNISGINVMNDVYFCNVMKCHPTNNRKPNKKEVLFHKPWLLKQIELIEPKIVLLTGAVAMKTILEIKDPISFVRGKWIFKNGIEYMIIFHPSYLLRFSPNQKNNPYSLTLKDLLNVRNKLYNL